MTTANRKSTTGGTDSQIGTAQINDARPDLGSTTKRRASLPLLRHEVLAAEADEHNRGWGLGIEPAHHTVCEPHHPHEALSLEHQTARHLRRAPKSRAELGAEASAASELRGRAKELNGGRTEQAPWERRAVVRARGARHRRPERERRADEEAGSRDEGARRVDWVSWARL